MHEAPAPTNDRKCPLDLPACKVVVRTPFCAHCARSRWRPVI